MMRSDIDVLRPAPAGALAPYDMERVIGKRLKVVLRVGEHLTWEKLES